MCFRETVKTKEEGKEFTIVEMGSNYGLARDFSSGGVKVRMGFVGDLEVAMGRFMDVGDGRRKASSSVKDGSKVSGLGRRSESRRAPTQPKARRVLYLFYIYFQ